MIVSSWSVDHIGEQCVRCNGVSEEDLNILQRRILYYWIAAVVSFKSRLYINHIMHVEQRTAHKQ